MSLSYKNVCGLVAFFLIVTDITSCKKFLEIPPPQNQLTSSNVFSTDATAMSAQSAIYGSMGPGSADFYNLCLYPAFSSDELIDYSTNITDVQLYSNSLTSDNSYIQTIWSVAYNYIYQANAVLEAVTSSIQLSDGVKKQLLGESKFTRAFWQFYLVNDFGSVPLVTSTNYQTNNTAIRSSVAQVYQQIIKDLTDAVIELNPNFVGPDGYTQTNDRERPTQSAAAALLARVYLYEGKYDSAEQQATSVINNSSFSLLSDLNSVFLANSQESIWQIGSTQGNTNEAFHLILLAPPQGGGQSISSQLMNAFEPGDMRRVNWIDSLISGNTTYYFPYKYKNRQISPPVTEFETVLRLSEQYLIRAEAEAQLGDSTDAIVDLNLIRTRAQLPPYSATIQGPLLLSILHERQVELFTEFGHRWFDLKRTGNVDAVMSVVTPTKDNGMWQTTQQLYPIPLSEIKTNSRLSQNRGY
jgi:hypothetical protein